MVACVYKMTTIHAHRVHVQVYASRLTQSAFPPVAARGEVREGGGAFGICLVEFGKKAEAASLQLRVFSLIYSTCIMCTYIHTDNICNIYRAESLSRREPAASSISAMPRRSS